MPVYQYKGMTSGGRSTSALVDAENAREARAKLRRDGIFPTEITETSGRVRANEPKAKGNRSFSLPSFRRISGMDLALATRQLSTMIGASVPLVEALSALTEQVENNRLKSVIASVRERVNEGSTLADAMAQSGPFSDLYVSMVRAGETGGALETVLARLAEYLESQVRLRNKVTSIMIYPALMFVVALVVVAVLVTVVLPPITSLLLSLGAELPIYTRAIIAGADLVRNWWWAIILSVLVSASVLRAVIRTERGRIAYDQFKLRLPILGRVNRVLAISRFTRTLSTLLAGGIPIVRSLDIARHVANNRVIGAAVDEARESITKGASIAAPLRQSGQFPALVTYMVDVGERSGELESMLNKVAETYDEQVETTVTRMTALMEPLLILAMVGVVGFIIASTLVPMLNITNSF